MVWSSFLLVLQNINWSMVEALGTVFSVFVALLLAVFYVPWREKHQRKERHKKHVGLLKYELERIRDELKEDLEVIPQPKGVEEFKKTVKIPEEVQITGLLSTVIFDALTGTAMHDFNAENLIAIIEAIHNVHEINENIANPRHIGTDCNRIHNVTIPAIANIPIKTTRAICILPL